MKIKEYKVIFRCKLADNQAVIGNGYCAPRKLWINRFWFLRYFTQPRINDKSVTKSISHLKIPAHLLTCLSVFFFTKYHWTNDYHRQLINNLKTWQHIQWFIQTLHSLLHLSKVSDFYLGSVIPGLLQNFLMIDWW